MTELRLGVGGIVADPERPPQPAVPSTMTVRSLLHLLRRRKFAVIVPIVACLLLGWASTRYTVPKYTAEAIIQAETPRNMNPGHQVTVTSPEAELAKVNSEIDLIKSPTSIERVISRLDLDRDPEFNPTLKRSSSQRADLVGALAPVLPEHWRTALLSWLEPRPVPEQRLRGIIGETVRAGLRVTNAERSYSIVIAFTCEDAEKAASIANTFAEVYLSNQLEAKVAYSKRMIEWLSGRLAALKDEVRIADEAIEAHRAQIGMIDAKGNTVEAQRLVELNTQLVVARAELAQAEARLKSADHGGDRGGDRNIASSPDVQSSPVIQVLRQQEAQVRQHLNELAGVYGERNPKLVAARSDLLTVQAKIAEETRRVIDDLAKQLMVARSKEASLESAMAELEAKSAENARSGIGLRELERVAMAKRTLYEEFLNQYTNMRDRNDLERPDSKLVSSAMPPPAPNSPAKLLVLVVAATLGALIGVFLAFLFEHLDTGFREAEVLQQLSGSRVLGVVPQLPWRDRQRIGDYVLRKPLSAYNEVLRTVDLSLYQPAARRQSRIVIVTSAMPGEGKTVFCLSYARSLARAGKLVLLIDCDLRRPQIGRLLGGREGPGLIGVLGQQVTLEEAVCVDQASGLHYLPTREVETDPKKFLASDLMVGLLEQCEQYYDLIVLDSSPIGLVSDVGVLFQKNLGRCLFVVRWASTPRKVVADAIERTLSLGADIAGIVMTQVDMRQYLRYGESGSRIRARKYNAYYQK